jgi:hypothetical protein
MSVPLSFAEGMLAGNSLELEIDKAAQPGLSN